MRPVTVTLVAAAGAANSSPIPMDWRANPFSVGLGFDTNGTTTGFTVQHSFEDPNNYATATAYNTDAKWFDHPQMASMTADEDGNYAFPVRAIRLHCDASGSDTGVLTIIQSGVGD